MTREEAVAVLRELIEAIEDDQAYSQLTYGMYKDGYRRIDAYKTAIAALRSPERDPDTGAKDAFSLRMTAIRRFIGIRTECTPESKATGSGCIIGTNQSKTPPEVEE